MTSVVALNFSYLATFPVDMTAESYLTSHTTTTSSTTAAATSTTTNTNAISSSSSSSTTATSTANAFMSSDLSSMSGLRSERNMHPLLDDDTVARVVDEFFRRMLASQKAAAACNSVNSASDDEDGNESDGPGCADEAHLHQLLTYFAAVALGEDANHAQSMKRAYYDADHQPITQRFFDCALRHLDAALQSNVPIEVSRRIVGAVKALRPDVVTEPLLNK